VGPRRVKTRFFRFAFLANACYTPAMFRSGARNGLRLAILIFSLTVAAARAQRDGPPGDGPRGGGPPLAPPQFAVDACRGSAEGAGCTATTPRGTLTGTCALIEGQLACLPDDGPRRGDRQRREGRPARTTRDPVPPAPEPAAAAPVMIPAPAPAAIPVVPVPEPASVQAPPPAPASAPEPSAPVGGLLPLAEVLAAAAALLFVLWRIVLSFRYAPTVPLPPPTVPAPAAAPPVAAVVPPKLASAKTLIASLPVGPNGGLLIGGNFEPLRQLGSGGMGVVFEAHDMRLDRRVAIKKMRPEIGRSPRDRDRFLSEARMVAKLQHPNIVGIHAIVEEAGDLYLVFEYVDGMTLDDLILREKFLAPKKALEILAGVASAVDHAHDERVIHRDLKPANIMIDKNGRAKVMDFGIAHQAQLTISRLTMAEAYGTLAYMPPEQELGKAVRESDIYAFAAVTYEALTGGLPFPGPNFHLQKASMSFLRPSEADPTLPRGVDAVFERALQPEPKSRYPTTGEFLLALDGALARKRA
jgi:predicted Ser/Thr protein kinase